MLKLMQVFLTRVTDDICTKDNMTKMRYCLAGKDENINAICRLDVNLIIRLQLEDKETGNC